MTNNPILDNKFRYSPPKSDIKSLTIALTIFISFILFWHHALFEINFAKNNWFDIIGTFFILEFLYTGLFITCHDAMHGTVCYRVSFLINIKLRRYCYVATD